MAAAAMVQRMLVVALRKLWRGMRRATTGLTGPESEGAGKYGRIGAGPCKRRSSGVHPLTPPIDGAGVGAAAPFKDKRSMRARRIRAASGVVASRGRRRPSTTQAARPAFRMARCERLRDVSRRWTSLCELIWQTLTARPTERG